MHYTIDGWQVKLFVCLFINGLFRPGVSRRTTSVNNIITTSPDNTQSPAASASSPAGPYLRCHRGDTLRIAALTQGGVLYVRNFVVPYAEIFTYYLTYTDYSLRSFLHPFAYFTSCRF